MEKKKKLGQQPAFPSEDVLERTGVGPSKWTNYKGISERTYIATKAMQGIVGLLNPEIDTIYYDQIAIDAYLIADAMLRNK